MSKTYIPVAIRNEVIERAQGCCEYCLSNTEDRSIDFAIDHVIAEKHGGSTHLDNLCLSCYWCNSYKGSDLTSIDWGNNRAVVTLFNPREQSWTDHFELDEEFIIPLTPHGRVTITLLQLNTEARRKERSSLIELGVYPCIPYS